MKNFFMISLLIVGLSLLTFSAAAQKIKPSPTPVTVQGTGDSESIRKKELDFLGEIEGNAYKNRFFNLKLVIPDNWQLQESEVGREIKQLGSQLAKGKTSQTQKALDEAMERVTPLFTASRDVLGMEANVIFVLAAEKKPPLTQIRNGEDYLRLNIQTFKKLQLPADFKYSETIKSEKYGKETFYYLEIERSGYRQRIYAFYRNGYALFFTLTFIAEEDLEMVKAIFRNSDFDWKE